MSFVLTSWYSSQEGQDDVVKETILIKRLPCDSQPKQHVVSHLQKKTCRPGLCKSSCTTVLHYNAVCQTFTFADATICILHSAMSHFWLYCCQEQCLKALVTPPTRLIRNTPRHKRPRSVNCSSIALISLRGHFKAVVIGVFWTHYVQSSITWTHFNWA